MKDEDRTTEDVLREVARFRAKLKGIYLREEDLRAAKEDGRATGEEFLAHLSKQDETMSNQALIGEWNRELEGKSPEDVLGWAVRRFGGKVAFASSLGLEDQALMDMIVREKLEIPIFTLDTGRLFQETYELIERTVRKYRIKIRVYSPQTQAVEGMVAEHGINLFRESVELRKMCCGVRKIEPLRRALAGLEAWVVGLRRGQSVTRAEVSAVEWDAGNALVKINPLAAWSEEQAWAYVKANQVPYNRLHDEGFPSIGCACCTRAVRPGEDIRAGRWWWESPEHKECGLHQR